MSESSEPFGISTERLRARLEALGLSALAAAKKAGLGDDYVRDLLRGKVREPSAARLRRLANALECSPSYLLGFGEIREPVMVPFLPPLPDVKVDRIVAESIGDDTSMFAFSRVMLERSLSEKILDHLPASDAKDLVFISDGHGPSEFRLKAHVAHGLGLITPRQRDLLVALTSLEAAAGESQVDFASEEHWQHLAPYIDISGDGEASATREARRYAFGIVTGAVGVALMRGAKYAADDLRSVVDEMLAAPTPDNNSG